MSEKIDSRGNTYVISEDDWPYEEEMLRNPYSMKHWQRYIDHLKNTKSPNLNVVFRRALEKLPGSYKLWYNYLCNRRTQLKTKCIDDKMYEDVNNDYERALVFMHKMPRIWIEYCGLVTEQCYITRTRQVFDRALRALPITQHHRIWPLYLEFVSKHDIAETAVRVFRRYLKLAPEDTEDYIEYLVTIGRLDEAAVKLAYIVNQDDFVSKHGKSNHQLWNELCNLISKNPTKIKSLNVDAIIRGGLRRYTDQLGPLWNALADYYVRSGLFERARDIYEEAIQTVTTVRDFTQVFDAYAQFEELSLSKRMEEAANNPNPTPEDDIDLELRLARFEHLMDRRLLLLNSVMLRQNPHNVQEWHKRVRLYENQPHEIISTYMEAVQTVQPQLAVGKLHTLWVSFAKFYEANNQLDDARAIFEEATRVPYTKVDDLASVWCAWAEMEIDHGNFNGALKLMHRATAMPSRRVAYHDESEAVQMRLYKSLKVWCLYADLEECYGTFRTCKAVYDKIIDLKIATPHIIMSYGLFLEEKNYFEEAFRAYEKGIALFKWPNVYDIWKRYLEKFLQRYGGEKLERTRDLFEQCLEHCPPKYAKTFYQLYAKFEEEHGLKSRVMSVYERATEKVPNEEKFVMFNIYIEKAADIYGIPKTRQIYEKAIDVLNEENTREMSLRFADMETKLGEVDRARAIYSHCSQICDPRVTSNFWQVWKDFEVRHGNEDTMREMLRIKRSVQAMYNTQINMMSAQMLNTATSVQSHEIPDAMKLLDSKVAATGQTGAMLPKDTISFVRGVTEGGNKTSQVTNPDEIDIDIDEDDGDSEDEAQVEEEVPVEKQLIPSQVFGSLKMNVDGNDD
ncbi:pre-mRNA-splicing factor SYF1 [Diachasma alloeum]|uniref:pre-mRNA-splicing factor SYF1 n=1 Tax=Diachasma alloeum TaxID=454923 RepID=UPI00073845A8|nr:pre-mRNA-splicing factor SYF1 [Diachasma alloeum]XP_015122344.1 pre-mRNA-splicing factor SYF1 [Diachasma alloeum]